MALGDSSGDGAEAPAALAPRSWSKVLRRRSRSQLMPIPSSVVKNGIIVNIYINWTFKFDR